MTTAKPFTLKLSSASCNSTKFNLLTTLTTCLCAALLPISAAHAADKNPDTLRGVLLQQLKTTDDAKDWFVPISVAVQGLTAQQAQWKDPSGNHSIGQLTYHLLFWNTRELEKLEKKKSAAFSGNNEETFNNFDSKQWSETVSKLGKVMKDLEQFTANADETTLKQSASEIAHVGTHNAYHVGQIVLLRKLQGSWNPETGVK